VFLPGAPVAAACAGHNVYIPGHADGAGSGGGLPTKPRSAIRKAARPGQDYLNSCEYIRRK